MRTATTPKRFVNLIKFCNNLDSVILLKNLCSFFIFFLLYFLYYLFQYQFISEILRWRAVSTSDHVIFTSLNAKGAVATSLSCLQLHKKAERIGNLLLDRGRVNTGDHVALIFPPGTDLICAFYGCLYVGAVPVTIRPPHPQNLQTTLPTVRMIVDVSKSVLVLTNQNIMKLLKTKVTKNT